MPNSYHLSWFTVWQTCLINLKLDGTRHIFKNAIQLIIAILLLSILNYFLIVYRNPSIFVFRKFSSFKRIVKKYDVEPNLIIKFKLGISNLAETISFEIFWH